jgi:hypothetical protein
MTYPPQKNGEPVGFVFGLNIPTMPNNYQLIAITITISIISTITTTIPSQSPFASLQCNRFVRRWPLDCLRNGRVMGGGGLESQSRTSYFADPASL